MYFNIDIYKFIDYNITITSANALGLNVKSPNCLRLVILIPNLAVRGMQTKYNPGWVFNCSVVT